MPITLLGLSQLQVLTKDRRLFSPIYWRETAVTFCVSGEIKLPLSTIATPDRRSRIANLPVHRSPKGLSIGSMSVVEFWETPLQELLASEALALGGRIFEVGYGLGLCARQIAAASPIKHLVVEAHPDIANAAEVDLALTKSEVLCEFWEDVLPNLEPGAWDAIAFDAYPLDGVGFKGSASEVVELVLPALELGSRALRPGGKFLFLDFTGDVVNSDILRRVCGRLFKGEIKASQVVLQIPLECTYAYGTTGYVVALLT